jgi:hypothetical protein
MIREQLNCFSTISPFIEMQQFDSDVVQVGWQTAFVSSTRPQVN